MNCLICRTQQTDLKGVDVSLTFWFQYHYPIAEIKTTFGEKKKKKIRPVCVPTCALATPRKAGTGGGGGASPACPTRRPAPWRPRLRRAHRPLWSARVGGKGLVGGPLRGVGPRSSGWAGRVGEAPHESRASCRKCPRRGDSSGSKKRRFRFWKHSPRRVVERRRRDEGAGLPRSGWEGGGGGKVPGVCPAWGARWAPGPRGPRRLAPETGPCTRPRVGGRVVCWPGAPGGGPCEGGPGARGAGGRVQV